MRILHLNTESGFRGGERQLLLLARGLRDRGHEQLVACLEGAGLFLAMKAEGIPVAGYRRAPILGVRAPWLRFWLRRAAEEFAPDVVHTHSGNAHTFAAGALLARFPIVTTRRVDFALKRNPATRRKYTAPGQHFIAISSGVREALLRGGVPEEIITLVPSGIDPARVTGGDGTALRREWLGGAEGGPLVGFTGALVDHKAPWILAEAAPLLAARHPGARIVFIGEGECRPRIEEIQRQHPTLIHLAGWREDIADCLAALDLFVMPSQEEGLCTSIADAMAAGIPCVASRAGGIPDLVLDGSTGVLVPPLDAEALAAALADLWDDAPRRERLAAAAREHVRHHFTADAMVEGTLRVYEMLSPSGCGSPTP